MASNFTAMVQDYQRNETQSLTAAHPEIKITLYKRLSCSVPSYTVNDWMCNIRDWCPARTANFCFKKAASKIRNLQKKMIYSKENITFRSGLAMCCQKDLTSLSKSPRFALVSIWRKTIIDTAQLFPRNEDIKKTTFKAVTFPRKEYKPNMTILMKILVPSGYSATAGGKCGFSALFPTCYS